MLFKHIVNRMPVIKALLIQLLAYLCIAPLIPFFPSLTILAWALIQSITAAIISYYAKMAYWWIPIQLSFLPANSHWHWKYLHYGLECVFSHYFWFMAKPTRRRFPCILPALKLPKLSRLYYHRQKNSHLSISAAAAVVCSANWILCVTMAFFTA